MPVQIEIPAAFAFGQLLAMAARKSLKMGERSVRDRFLLWTNWYMALIFSPTGLFLLVGWPAWETMYQWAWVENPQFKPFVALFYVVFLMLIVILGNAGFLLSCQLVRHDRDSMAKAILALSAIIVPIPYIIDIKPLLYIGTYQQYHAGSAPSILGSSFSPSWFGIISIILFWTIASILCVKKFYLEDKSGNCLISEKRAYELGT